jgi:hypothetical protein
MQWWEYSEFRERGVPFAVDAQGHWRDVDAVPRGKACGCFCPDCQGPLIARQGDVLVHHFAHDDRRECRHALEASLYGMAINLLTEPGAVLLLPPADPIAEFTDSLGLTPEEQAILRTSPAASVSPSGLLPLESAQVRCPDLQSVRPDRPDLVLLQPRVAIHFLSHKKNYEQALAAPHQPQTTVVGLNLRAYVNLWWQTCDADKETTLRVVSEARALLREWLTTSTLGRGWLHHPALERAVSELQVQAEAAREVRRLATERELRAQQEAARREQEKLLERRRAEERRWRIPSPAADAESDQLMMKAATPDAHAWLSHSLATSYGVEWHHRRRLYFYVGGAGDLVRDLAREILDPDAPWEPVRPADEAAFNVFLPSAPPEPASLPPSLHLAPPSPVPPPAQPDEILRTTEKKCWCGTALDEVRLGSGFYAGKRVLRCAANPKHPLTVLGP